MGNKFSYDYVKSCVESHGYLLISKKYINSSVKLNMICPIGHKYSSTFSNFKNNDARCKNCANDSMAKNRKHSFEYVDEFISNCGYFLLDSKYINNRAKLLVKCPAGHNYKVSFSNFSSGKRCSTCEIQGRSERNRNSIENVRKELGSNGYILVSNKYANARTRIQVECPSAHLICITMGHFHSGKRCPKCILQPKGERLVEESLIESSVEYVYQKKFDDCKDKRILSFDFYVPEKSVAIEVQGRQHYEPVDFFGGNKQFKNQKRRDRIKKKYCKRNNIELLEIAYWDFDNIDKILKKELNT